MITVSNACLQALQAGAPQRWVFEWQDTEHTILTNEDISVEEGVAYDEVFCSETDLTVGLTPSSQISFTMLNGQYQWTGFSFGWFKASLGVRLTSVKNTEARNRHPTVTVSGNTATVVGNGVTETYELVPFGWFYAERPDVLRKTLIAVDGFDRMTLFERDMPSATALGITYPVTALTLLQAMCTHLGVQLETTTFLNSGLTLEKEPKSFSSASMREVLGWIAEAACAVARFSREGSLRLLWLNSTSVSYDEHGYTGFERTEYETTSVSKLSIRNADQTEETVLGTGDSPYMIQDNPFLMT